MQDSSASHFIDEQIYAVQASYRLYTKKTVDGVVIVDKQKINIELAKCNTLNLDKQYYHNVDLNNMYCFKNITLPMLINGNFESDTWGWIYIGFNRCSGSNCKSAAEIEAKLRRSFFAMNFVNIRIQSSNYDNPIVYFPDSFFTSTSSTYSKILTMTMEDTELLTHSSLVGYAEPHSQKLTKVKIGRAHV